MNKKDYIGIDLAKHLHEKWFVGETKYFGDGNFVGEATNKFIRQKMEWGTLGENVFPLYSYYQILTSLAKELFGEDIGTFRTYTLETGTSYYEQKIPNFYGNSIIILQMLQQNKPQEEIDEYIKSNLIDKWK